MAKGLFKFINKKSNSSVDNNRECRKNCKNLFDSKRLLQFKIFNYIASYGPQCNTGEENCKNFFFFIVRHATCLFEDMYKLTDLSY